MCAAPPSPHPITTTPTRPPPLTAAAHGAELTGLADAALLRKYLKVTAEELEVGGLAEAQLVRIAARDC